MTEFDKSSIELIGGNLDALQSSATWIFVTLFILFLANIKDGELQISSFRIRAEYGGVALYGILCGLNFQVLHLLQNISDILETIPDTKSVISLLKLQPWILNPFIETTSFAGFFFDSIGSPASLFLWWIGFIIAQILFLKSKQKLSPGVIMMLSIYLIIGVGTLIGYFVAFLLLRNLPLFRRALKIGDDESPLATK